MKKLIIVSLGIIFGFLVIGGYAALFFMMGTLYSFLTSPSHEQTLDSDKLFQIANKWRVEKGYQLYKTSSLSCEVASIRSFEIRKKFSHDGFEAKRFCFGCSLGENLSQGFETEDEAFEGWLNSPAHLENLQKDFPNSCIKCINSSCVHIFSNF